MLDSGLIYTTGSILVLCTIPSVNLAYCVSDVVTPFIVSAVQLRAPCQLTSLVAPQGIAFNLIIIHIDQGKVVEMMFIPE